MRYFLAILILLAQPVFAQVPYKFHQGQKASAKQVNENFKYIDSTNDAQNDMLSAVINATGLGYSQSMICLMHLSSGGSQGLEFFDQYTPEKLSCRKSGEQGAIHLTIQDILNEGWVMDQISTGLNHDIFQFRK